MANIKTIILCFTVGIVPLIVRYSYAENDFFCYFKSMAVIALGALALPLALRPDWSWRGGLFIGYAALIIASQLFSAHPGTALWGCWGRYEGTLALLAYLVLAAAAWRITAGKIRTILAAMFISAGILGAIGSFQFFGFDLFKSAPGLIMLFYPTPGDQTFLISYHFPAGVIYATLSNPNYVGSYAAMLLLLSFGIAMTSRRPIIQYGMAAFTLFSEFIIIGSRSRSGMVAALAAGWIMLIVLKHACMARPKFTCLFFALIITVAVTMSVTAPVSIPAGMAQSFDNGLSGRVEIWRNTIPELGKTLILGHGADTYSMFYPQRANAETIFNPHNLYMQIWTASGAISLAVFLAIVGLYMRRCFKLYTGTIRATDPVGLGIMGAVLAYLIAGIGNDSVVAVAPVFWVLLGIGLNITSYNANPAK